MNNESGVSSKIFEDTKSSLENVCRAICPPKNQDIDIASLLHEIGIYTPAVGEELTHGVLLLIILKYYPSLFAPTWE